MKIEVDCNKLKKCGEFIKYNNDNLETQAKKLHSIVNSIQYAWGGNDATKYIETMREYYVSSLTDLKNCINQYGIYLERAADCYEKLDDSFASKKII